jgi:hypothetical protein
VRGPHSVPVKIVHLRQHPTTTWARLSSNATAADGSTPVREACSQCALSDGDVMS